ncbi:MAG: DNA polymerase III subunit gamma/tau [Pseudomonadales bacterium]|nr:DNA polymerase III subunit gamma/tau [Pseudomonadales bacterium]
MSYQVLALKYRPSCFSEVVGQESTVQVLANALDKGLLHHAYLFTGTRGVGKTTIARLLAAALNCEQGVSSKPCGSCSACTEVRRGTFVDLMEVDAASRTGVEDTRALLENVQYMPVSGRHKVYLIDEVHMLSRQSFNALLKTLEEPPDYAKFLLATTEPRKIPVTVLSRCLQFILRNISRETIVAKLAEILSAESIEYDLEVLPALAKAASGSMRDALSLTDQAIAFAGGGRVELDAVLRMLGIARGEQVTELMAAIVRQDRAEVFRRSRAFADTLTNFQEVMASMQSICHELAMAQAAGREVGANLKEIARLATPEWIQTAYQILLMGQRDLSLAPDLHIGFEMTLVRLLDFEPLLPQEAGSASSGPKSEWSLPASAREASSPRRQRERTRRSRTREDASRPGSARKAHVLTGEEREFKDKILQMPSVRSLVDAVDGSVIGVRRIASDFAGGSDKDRARSERLDGS